MWLEVERFYEKNWEKGQKLQRSGYNESWSRVIYEDQECYIASAYVERAEEASSDLEGDT